MTVKGDFTLQGPKVHARREGTADAGGGQIYAGGGVIAVQGAVRGRQLGPLAQLAAVTFLDHRGRNSEWLFADETRWSVQCDAADLVQFAETLAIHLGRPEMVRKAARPSERLWSNARDQRTELAVAGGCALATLPTVWLVSMLPALGYLLVVIGLAWLVAATIARLPELAPKSPNAGTLVARARRASWVVAWVVPAILLVGSMLGIAEAADRSKTAAVAAQRAATLAATETAGQEAAAERKAATETQIDEKLAQMSNAMRTQQYDRAAELHAQAAELDPHSAKVHAAGATLAPKLSENREIRRSEDASSGLTFARRVTSDHVLCETAKPVADAWARLKHTAPDDKNFTSAQRLAGKLERCRQRVLQTFTSNAEAVRAQARVTWGTQLELEMRKRGVAASIKLAGRSFDRLEIAVGQLTDDVVETIMGGRPNLEQRASREGFARVTLRAGKRSRRFKLVPAQGGDVIAVLEPFGLAQPLGL